MRIIAGLYKGRILKTTTGPGLRPAMGKVREALFSMLDALNIDWQHTTVLDLYAGTGSLGFEALSRGAANVCFVDSAKYAVDVIQRNAALLDIPQGKMQAHLTEVGKFISRRATSPYQLVFIDPPYAVKALEHTLQTLRKNSWLADDSVINAEVESRTPVALDRVNQWLSPIADRSYGQTRVLLWKNNPQ